MKNRKNLRYAGLKSRRKRGKKHPLIPVEKEVTTKVATWIESDNDFGHGNYCKYASPGIPHGKVPQEGDSPTLATGWIYQKVGKICDCSVCQGYTNRFGDFSKRKLSGKDLGFVDGTTIELHSNERLLQLNIQHTVTGKPRAIGLGKILRALSVDTPSKWSTRPFRYNGRLYWPKATIEHFDRLKETEKPLTIVIKMNGSLYDDKIDIEGYRQMNGRFDKRMGDR